MFGPERLWGSRATMAVRFGVPAGLCYAAIWFAGGRSASDAIASGAVFAVLFGIGMAVLTWRRWPGARSLTSRERGAVVRAVERGEEVKDPQLARGVIDYAGYVERTVRRERDHRWVLPLFGLLTVALAVAETAAGASSRSVVLWWALSAFWPVFLVREPVRRERRMARAQRAQRAARGMLGAEPGAGR
jgi:hypothetical protein